MIELIIFILLVFVALMIGYMYVTPIDVSENMSVAAPAGILLPRDHVNKGLHVGFAELRSERVFSKKTGKVKYDKVSYT